MGVRRSANRTDVREGLVVVGCSRRKNRTDDRLPALDLYEGWCVPALRDRVAAHPALKQRVLVLSARHGLVRANEPLAPYNEQLTPSTARHLQPSCDATLREHLVSHPADEALLLLEPHYAHVLHRVDDRVTVVHKFPEPTRNWDAVLGVLDAWGWP
jgi:hypothetical protein